MIIVIVSIINGRNHFEDKRQETGTPLYPLPPPLGVVFSQHITTGGIGVLYVSSIGVLCYMLVVSPYPIYC